MAHWYNRGMAARDGDMRGPQWEIEAAAVSPSALAAFRAGLENDDDDLDEDWEDDD